MDDLISRQAAIDALYELYHNRPLDYGRIRMRGDVLNTIENVPSAERRGRWIKGDEMADYPRVPYKPWETYCSCCREIKEQNHDDFCGNCGASMRGE